MSDRTIRFGLTLPNRGVIIGATTVEEMFALAQKADAAGWDSVWVGDSLFAVLPHSVVDNSDCSPTRLTAQ